MEQEPHELQNISTLINSRFRISPPLFADPLNPLVQVPSRVEPAQLDPFGPELYSPTTPLDLCDLPSDRSPTDRSQALSAHTPILSPMVRAPQILGLHAGRQFPGKRRWDCQHNQPQSVSSYLGPMLDVTHARKARQKRRLEEWDSKGGFTIWGKKPGVLFHAKSLTDVSMVRNFGVGADVTTFVPSPKKRAATTSPLCSTSPWSLKRGRLSPEDPMAVQDDASSLITHTPMETQVAEAGLETTQPHTEAPAAGGDSYLQGRRGFSHTALQTEIIACHLALSWASARGLTHILILTDST
ncbi:hypothetical protein BVRB_1g016020 [Beta vulgaris subsp. vulgaris]|nr:hypothetical protein BVRB_1g016020 [Beta vulgaris subsp. vulgaris]